MSVNWSKFFSSHSAMIILVTFNIFVLFTFMILYAWCNSRDPTSFNNANPKSNIIATNLTDHFLLSVAIQSGTGYASVTPVTNTAKILVSIQEFIVMTSGLVSVYLFIYLFNKKS
jgi:hypothetical protein